MKHSLIKFPNGLKVIVCSKQSSAVTLSFSLLFGAEQEKKNQSGITSVIEKLMHAELQKEVLKLGGIVDTKTDYEHLEITISTIRENLEKCLDVLNKAVFDFHPTYEEFREVKSKAQKAEASFFKDATHHDIVKYGLIPELVGRIPVIVSLDALDVEALVSILTKPRNAIVKQYKKLFGFDGLEIEFTEEAVCKIAELAKERGTGARGLRSIMDETGPGTKPGAIVFSLPVTDTAGMRMMEEIEE